MKRSTLNLLTLTALTVGLCAADKNWPPTPIEVEGRTTEVFRHGTRAEWGYPRYQDDSFVVVHPKLERSHAPLYVVLHSAGHNVWAAVQCTAQVGNHDIYHAPDDCYALYLDCRANKDDWWWGGWNERVPGTRERNAGGDQVPVEKRVVGTVKWAIERYDIDPNRVYLCGNSMGGSGALGIGLRHGDLFAAVKANVPAGIEHVSDRMYFPPASIPAGVHLPDPPVVINYSAQNDDWSKGQERFVHAMNERKYPLYFYWGPFGHANNDQQILRVNDLIHSFDWLQVKRNEAYAVFTNASCNDPLPWPDDRNSTLAGQINAFFHWNTASDTESQFEIELRLRSPNDLDTQFSIPTHATADVVHADGSGNYARGSVVTLNAPTSKDGKKFYNWTSNGGIIDSPDSKETLLWMLLRSTQRKGISSHAVVTCDHS